MKQLVQQLRESGYLQFYHFFGEMNLRYKDWAAAAPGAPEPLRSLVNLFLLGESAPAPAVESLIGAEALRRLQSAAILLNDRGVVRSNSFYLLSYQGLLYFCQVSGDPFAYFGEDSLALSRYQTPLREGRVLDLCAGPGIQSLVSAQRKNRVTAVERHPGACQVHRINLELNQLADAVEVVNQPVEQFLASRDPAEKFDQILFNPPLVPMPQSVEGVFPAVGFGGKDGLELTSQILRDFRPLLAPTGHFEFVGMTYQPRRGRHPLARIARQLRLAGRLHLLSRHRIRSGAAIMEMHAASVARARSVSMESARQELTRLYRGCDCFFLFYARLAKSGSPRSTELETIDMSASHYGGWFS